MFNLEFFTNFLTFFTVSAFWFFNKKKNVEFCEQSYVVLGIIQCNIKFSITLYRTTGPGYYAISRDVYEKCSKDF